MTKPESDDRVARLIAAAKSVLAWADEGVGFKEPVLDALERALKPLSDEARCVHHPKRGHDYVVGGIIEMQISSGPYSGAEGKLVQVYHAGDGKGWGRFVEEFEDGRFVPATKDRP